MAFERHDAAAARRAASTPRATALPVELAEQPRAWSVERGRPRLQRDHGRVRDARARDRRRRQRDRSSRSTSSSTATATRPRCSGPCAINSDVGIVDTDGDGAMDIADNCPHVAESDRRRTRDGDEIGDACDAGSGPDRGRSSTASRATSSAAAASRASHRRRRDPRRMRASTAGRRDLRRGEGTGGSTSPRRSFGVGVFEGAQRTAFSEREPARPRRLRPARCGCSTSTGRYVVLEAVFADDGSVEHLAIDFEQHCEGGGARAVRRGARRTRSRTPLPQLDRRRRPALELRRQLPGGREPGPSRSRWRRLRRRLRPVPRPGRRPRGVPGRSRRWRLAAGGAAPDSARCGECADRSGGADSDGDGVLDLADHCERHAGGRERRRERLHAGAGLRGGRSSAAKQSKKLCLLIHSDDGQKLCKVAKGPAKTKLCRRPLIEWRSHREGVRKWPWASSRARSRSSPARAAASARRSRSCSRPRARGLRARRARWKRATHPLEGSLATTIAEIHAAGGEAVPIAADVSHYEDCERIVRETRAALGPIDVLVNNAALTYFIPIADFPPAKWLKSFAVNVHGPFFMTRLVLEDMLARKSGAIVNISSGAAIGPGRGPYKTPPMRGGTLYGAEKAALERFTQGLAAEVYAERCQRDVRLAVAGRRHAGRAVPQADRRARTSPQRGAGRADGARRAAARDRAARQGLRASHLQPADPGRSSAGSRRAAGSASTCPARATRRSRRVSRSASASSVETKRGDAGQTHQVVAADRARERALRAPGRRGARRAAPRSGRRARSPARWAPATA